MLLPCLFVSFCWTTAIFLLNDQFLSMTLLVAPHELPTSHRRHCRRPAWSHDALCAFLWCMRCKWKCDSTRTQRCLNSSYARSLLPHAELPMPVVATYFPRGAICGAQCIVYILLSMLIVLAQPSLPCTLNTSSDDASECQGIFCTHCR
jgi:hypothetical protein